MSSIDEIKDKINDGEYLNLCNLLKALNDEIKKSSNNEAEEQEEQEEQDGIYINDNLDETINNYWAEYYNRANSGIQHREFWQYLEGFNNLLEEIQDEYENNIDAPFFTCRCGCVVRANCAREHIQSDQHQNFHY
jgi:hypothetical protein